MSCATAPAPDELAVLRARVSEQAAEIAHLKLVIAKLRRMQVGRSSEQMDQMLGQLELRARNDKGAWQLETLNLRNPDGALNGRAAWRNDGAGRHQTRLDFELTASDVGRLLNRLGFVDAIRRGSATLAGDVRWDGPAFKAGISTGATVVAVNGQAYSSDGLKDAITAARTGTAPIQLLLKYQGNLQTVDVDYHGGLRYPHLVRIEGTQDYLDRIIAAK